MHLCKCITIRSLIISVEKLLVKISFLVCHHELNGPTGLFTTDNFPEDYKPSTNCSWNITVPEGQRVQLTFHLLNVSSIFYIDKQMWERDKKYDLWTIPQTFLINMKCHFTLIASKLFNYYGPYNWLIMNTPHLNLFSIWVITI